MNLNSFELFYDPQSQKGKSKPQDHFRRETIIHPPDGILLDLLSAPAPPAVGGLRLAHTARVEHRQHGIFLRTLQNRQHAFLFSVKTNTADLKRSGFTSWTLYFDWLIKVDTTHKLKSQKKRLTFAQSRAGPCDNHYWILQRSPWPEANKNPIKQENSCTR